MKYIATLIAVSAVVLMSYAARVSYQGGNVNATTTTNLYQIGTATSDFVTEVTVVNNGTNILYVLPNVATNAVSNPLIIQGGSSYQIEGDNIMWIKIGRAHV